MPTMSAPRKARDTNVPTDFSFLEESLEEQRIYRFTIPGCLDRLKDPAFRTRIDVLREEPDRMDVRGTHVLFPGCPDGVRAINDRLGVDLPPEVDDFYTRWNGGLLLHRELYRILPVQEIIATALEVRRIRREPRDRRKLPWHMLRFCEVWNGDYLALRRRAPHDWEVIWADIEQTDVDLLFPADPKVDANVVLDSSFLAWLRRMEETDGWPWGGRIRAPRDWPPGTRIW
ncbi:MAG TPA: SMI1/KNR4 family protein [Planctomycetota bacterium]|nr:SMI1/KNR4 family protein [Planctomycetota bacterium]